MRMTQNNIERESRRDSHKAKQNNCFNYLFWFNLSININRFVITNIWISCYCLLFWPRSDIFSILAWGGLIKMLMLTFLNCVVFSRLNSFETTRKHEYRWEVCELSQNMEEYRGKGMWSIPESLISFYLFSCRFRCIVSQY